MGWSQLDVFLVLAIFVSFLTLNAASNLVTEFCNQRKSTDDRSFCLKVFKSKPESNNAKDFPTLLKIGIGLAEAYANSTKEFLENLSKDKATNAALKPVLKECISAYDGALGQLKIILPDLKNDPPLASYDAHIANDELNRCNNSLNSAKVPHQPISDRHKTTVDYTRLVEEISQRVV